jgi:hypothetical protein
MRRRRSNALTAATANRHLFAQPANLFLASVVTITIARNSRNGKIILIEIVYIEGNSVLASDRYPDAGSHLVHTFAPDRLPQDEVCPHAARQLKRRSGVADTSDQMPTGSY